MSSAQIVSAEQLTADYRLMHLIRRCEEAIGRLLNEGLVHGTAHLSIGQEAVPVGFCSELTADDYLTTTYRGHGWALAKGVDLTGFFAELFGRESGVCRGRGGSMHLCDMGVGLIGASGIVGGGLPIAAGAAWAAQVRGTDQVAIVVVRRRGDEHRDVPRERQLRRRLAAPGRLRVREQPLRGVHARTRDVPAHRLRRAGRRLRHSGPRRGRQRRRGGARRRDRGGRSRPRRRRPDAGRGQDLPASRPFAQRSRHLPPRGGGRRLAVARPAPPGTRASRGAGGLGRGGRARADRRGRCGDRRCGRRGERGRLPRSRRARRPRLRVAARRRRPRRAPWRRAGGAALAVVSRGGARGPRRGAAARPLRRLLRRGRGGRRGRLQGHDRAPRGVRARARARHADLGERARRDGDRRGRGRAPARRRDHVRRLPRQCVRPARQPCGEAALHVGRAARPAARGALRARRRHRLRGPALAGRDVVAAAVPRHQDRRARDRRRREAAAAGGDPRPGSGALPRAQGALRRPGPRPGGGRSPAARHAARAPRRQRSDDPRARGHGREGAVGRGDARGRGRRVRGHRPARARAARRRAARRRRCCAPGACWSSRRSPRRVAGRALSSRGSCRARGRRCRRRPASCRAPNVPIPYGPVLEAAYQPSAEAIAEAARGLAAAGRGPAT